MNAAAVTDQLKDALARLPGEVIAVYLFGSVARGTAGDNSDVDLGLLYEKAPPRTLLGRPFGLADDLTRALGRKVDVVVMNDASPDLVHRVFRDGIILLDRDRSARIRFEVRARNQYFDMLPVLRRYREPVGEKSS